MGKTFAKLMTQARALVNKLPNPLGNFMIFKWVEKALPRSTQQKLRENLRPSATLADFVALATQVEDARLLFSTQTKDMPTATPTDASLEAIRREIEALKLQGFFKPSSQRRNKKSPPMKVFWQR